MCWIYKLFIFYIVYSIWTSCVTVIWRANSRLVWWLRWRKKPCVLIDLPFWTINPFHKNQSNIFVVMRACDFKGYIFINAGWPVSVKNTCQSWSYNCQSRRAGQQCGLKLPWDPSWVFTTSTSYPNTRPDWLTDKNPCKETVVSMPTNSCISRARKMCKPNFAWE